MNDFRADLLDRTQPAFAVILDYGHDRDDLPCDYDLPVLPPVGTTVTIVTVRGGEQHRFRVDGIELDLFPFNRDHGSRAFYRIKLVDCDGTES